MLRFKSSETADPSAETVPEICPKSRKTRFRVFGANPHCVVHFGGAAARPPMFFGIFRTLLMLRFKNAKMEIPVRKGRNLKSPKTTENPKQRPRGRMVPCVRVVALGAPAATVAVHKTTQPRSQNDAKKPVKKLTKKRAKKTRKNVSFFTRTGPMRFDAEKPAKKRAKKRAKKTQKNVSFFTWTGPMRFGGQNRREFQILLDFASNLEKRHFRSTQNALERST